MTEPTSLTSALRKLLERAIQSDGGWIGFDRFMAMALYAPGLGYYANALPKFGLLPEGVDGEGSDFATAPEISPLFGRALAAQVADALAATGTDEVWEFGAGSGALAHQMLDTLGEAVRRYTIVDLSGTLRARQQARLAPFGERVRWVDELPAALQGVVVGNEVLDAMPVKLLARHGGQDGGVWHERGVVLQGDALAWADRPTDLRPPVEVEGPQDYLTEIHPQAEAFMADVGLKDITAHDNFTGVALAGQDAGLNVLGYTSQARFLLNCGLAPLMETATLAGRTHAMKLIAEHEMGELFKVVAFCTGEPWDALGFRHGDRTHAL